MDYGKMQYSLYILNDDCIAIKLKFQKYVGVPNTMQRGAPVNL